MRKIHAKGFTLVETVVALLLVCLVVAGGWFVWHKSHVKNNAKVARSNQAASLHKPSTSSGMVISNDDGKARITIPSTWHITTDSNNPKGTQIISSNTNTQICKNGVCGTAGCLSIEDPTPCSYEAGFQPKALAALNQSKVANLWTLEIEKTSWTIDQAIQDRLGMLTSDNTITDSSNSINGYEARHVVTTASGGESYTDVYYFLKQNGYLLTFYNREKYINNSVNPDNEDYSAYENDFAKIVHSVQLKF
ncbi:MAG TPA: prepilin-type N-terminal cleavage/methylation domain-containing protein [Candidatus Saccharimonadia bacterium]|nr:prepilin-type N-terminal cleavage/methylation domain-containing protein [Candidatus Saccharimonadia bacterium]